MKNAEIQRIENQAMQKHNQTPACEPSFNMMKMAIDDEETPEPIQPLARQVVGSASIMRAQVRGNQRS